MNPYTVKNIKTFRGMEGHGFNATLYRDGKKVAFVVDDASGGCYRYEWVDGWGDNAPEARKLAEYAASLPMYDSEWGGSFQPDSDMVVSGLVDDADNQRRFKGRLARQIIIDTSDGIRSCPAKFKPTAVNIARVRELNPNATILNEMAFDDAFALFMAKVVQV